MVIKITNSIIVISLILKREKNTPMNSPDSKKHTSPPSPSPSRSPPSPVNFPNNSYSKLFEILNIPVTNIRREVSTAYRKLARLYHPDNWNSKKVLSKSVSEEKFKELVNAYDNILENVRLS